jgi:DNA integrity scanning protein DisA with diadenylate cyclase activity
MITAIDGAVLIDPTTTCYAIGVILDGLASNKGTPSRGARYNSAIRYVETCKYPCLAIIVSEDGSIDLVPDLMP